MRLPSTSIDIGWVAGATKVVYCSKKVSLPVGGFKFNVADTLIPLRESWSLQHGK